MHQQIHVFPTLDSLFDSMSGRVTEIANARIKVSGKFDFVITGGQSVIALYERLRIINTNWGAWRIFWSDERCYPINHPDRNSQQADDAWLRHVQIPKEQIFAIPSELGPTTAAKCYSQAIQRDSPFDLVLLSLGNDGHVASIFSGNEVEMEERLAIPVCDAPKDPPERVSMSLRSLAYTKTMMLLCVGDGKREALSAHVSGSLQPSTMLTQFCGHELWTETRHAEQIGIFASNASIST
jgi:6-phosphogluconolactonase